MIVYTRICCDERSGVGGLMGCTAAYNYIVEYLNTVISTVRQTTGDDGIALGIFTVTSVGLVLGLQWTNAVVAPRLSEPLLGDLYRKAEQWFEENKKTKFKGFRFETGLLAVLFGFVCYLWTKLALGAPRHWLYTCALLGTLAIGFSTQAIRVSPNIHFRAFFRYFYLPAASGIALGLTTAALDFLVGLLAFAITLGG